MKVRVLLILETVEQTGWHETARSTTTYELRRCDDDLDKAHRFIEALCDASDDLIDGEAYARAIESPPRKPAIEVLSIDDYVGGESTTTEAQDEIFD